MAESRGADRGPAGVPWEKGGEGMAVEEMLRPLWVPSAQRRREARITRYMEWLREHRGLAFTDYDSLWRWSVDDLTGFWSSIMAFFHVQAEGSTDVVLARRTMPGARWFPDVKLNYGANVFRNATPHRPALLFKSEARPQLTAVSWEELARDTAALADALRSAGVKRGDRVAAFLPNIPEAVVGLLACASIGAVWSSCSPDFGAPSVLDRFRQIEPKVLLAVDGYRYNGKPFDKRDVVAELQRELPGLERTVIVPYLHPQGDGVKLEEATTWDAFLGPHRREGGFPSFEPVPFDHPLWILYSSGTTGLPKPIVQGHGGIVLEHLKAIAFHMDLSPGDRLFWFTTTGWMMWNFIVGGLLEGIVPVLYDGSPSYPDMMVLWRLAEEARITCFGTSAAYISACMRQGVTPSGQVDLKALRSVGSTGSPLSPEGFQWVYEHVKDDVMLASISGGTDVCTAFVGSCPLLPVYAGEMQCRFLGAKVEAFDEAGRSVADQVGELVITEPLPSMPLYFWNDEDGERLRESYFSMYPGVWRHGDWIKITRRGSCIIYGRSDSTINRHGVRMGTSEIYRAVELVPEVADSLVIDLEGLGGKSFMPLFVVLRDGTVLDETLKAAIKDVIRRRVSPRHVPDAVYAVPDIPRTLNGKKLEVPVRKILLGVPPEKAVNPDSLANPQSLDVFVRLAQEWGGGTN